MTISKSKYPIKLRVKILTAIHSLHFTDHYLPRAQDLTVSTGAVGTESENTTDV